MQVNTDDDLLMRALSKVALEQAFESAARLAVISAEAMRTGGLPMRSGPEALEGFAKALLSTNAKTWPAGGTS